MKHRTRMLWCIIFLFPNLGVGQVKFGVDLTSRYIWRGLDYGNSPSVQPSLSVTGNGFTVGSWGAYSVGPSSIDSSGTSVVFSEHDLYASWSVPTSFGSFSLLYTDYFYPYNGLNYFDFSSSGGAHILEAGAGYSGPESFPVSFNVYYNFHNDPDHSLYVSLGYPVSIDGMSITFSMAGTPDKSVWYGTNTAGILSVAVTASRSLNVSESLTVPLTVSYQLNPYAEHSYLIFGITL